MAGELKEKIDNSIILRKDGFYVTANLRPVIVNSPTDGQLNGAMTLQLGVILIARHPCEILRVSEIHDGAGSGSIVVNSSDGAVCSFDMTGDADTVVNKEKTNLSNRQLKAGEVITLTSSGTLTNTISTNITIYLKYLGRGDYK